MPNPSHSPFPPRQELGCMEIFAYVVLWILMVGMSALFAGCIGFLLANILFALFYKLTRQ